MVMVPSPIRLPTAAVVVLMMQPHSPGRPFGGSLGDGDTVERGHKWLSLKLGRKLTGNGLSGTGRLVSPVTDLRWRIGQDTGGELDS